MDDDADLHGTDDPKITDEQLQTLIWIAKIAEPIRKLTDSVDDLLFWAGVRSDYVHAIRIVGRICGVVGRICEALLIAVKWISGICFVVILYLTASLGVRDFTELVERLQDYIGSP